MIRNEKLLYHKRQQGGAELLSLSPQHVLMIGHTRGAPHREVGQIHQTELLSLSPQHVLMIGHTRGAPHREVGQIHQTKDGQAT
jgi:hypothetical protein